MRRAILLALVVACGSTAKPPPAAPAAAKPAPAPMRCADLRAPVERVVASDLAKMPPDAKKQASIAQIQTWFSSQMIEACSADAWAPDTIACVANGKTTDDWSACRLTPAQMESFRARFAVGPDGAPARTYDLAPDLGIPACDDYLRAIGRALACPQLDEASRDQLRSTVESQKQQWRAMPRGSAAEEKAIADSCALSMSALVKAASADGCRV